MKIVIGKMQLVIVVVVLVSISGIFLALNQKISVGHGYNTVIASGSSGSIPALGACTGALGQSREYLLRVQSDNFQHPVLEALQQLDDLTITCNGPKDIMQLPDNFTNLGGQCCGALMNLTEYNEQLEGLKDQFSNISDIPQNPYNISVALAKDVIAYDLDTALTPDQQVILEDATKLSKEGGPCCCKCWHWYFNEGIAKKLVKNYGFTAHQIANFYDLSDICGI